MHWLGRTAVSTAVSVMICGTTIATRGADVVTNFLGAVMEDTRPPIPGANPRFRPDSMGTVGGDHIVLMINGRYRAWDKDNPGSGPLAGHDTLLRTFWIANGALSEQDKGRVGDPRVVYDPFANRFFAVSLVYDSGKPNYFLVAVSESNTLTPLDSTETLFDRWRGFKVDSDSDDRQWMDFPMLGVNRDSVIVGGSMFPLDERADNEFNVLAIPKESLLASIPSTDGYHLFEDKISITLEPAHPVMDLENNPLPAPLLTGGPDFIRRTDVISIDPAVLTGDPNQASPVDITIDDLDDAPNGDQPNSAPALYNIHGPDSFYPVRLSSNSVRQNGFNWGVQGREDPVTGRAAVRWFKIDPSTNQVADQGLISGPTTHPVSGATMAQADLLYPSIAVNKVGDLVVGFTATGSDLYPSSYAAVGKVVGGSVVFAGANIMALEVGKGTFDGTQSPGGTNPWGDYSATVVDPVNPLRFWTFQEFVEETDEWGIQITEISVRDDVDGDMDFDGDVDLDDVSPFVLALNDDLAYHGAYGALRCFHGDIDDDGDMDLDDVDDWVSVLNNGPGSTVPHCNPPQESVGLVPEPSCFTLMLIAVIMYRVCCPRTASHSLVRPSC